MATQAPAVKTPGRSMKPPLYQVLGGVDDKRHQKFVREAVERITWYGSQLQDYWIKTVKWMSMYNAQRDEFRQLPEEGWRAKIYVPDPYAGIETKTAILTDILTSTDPAIQAEGIHDKGYEPAKKMERLLTYTTVYNRWKGKTLPGLIRMAGIQGTEHYKVTWLEDIYEVELPTSDEDVSEFQKRLGESFDALKIQSADQVPDYLMDAKGFMDWRDQANTALTKSGIQIPEPPLSGKREIIRYRGPKIERISLYDVFIDPLIDDMQDQVFVGQRILKPQSFAQGKVASGAWDADAVERCQKAGSGDQKPNTNDQALNDILGIKQNQSHDPTLGQPLDEIFEIWQLGDETPYAVMLNRQGVVNKDPGVLPFVHGQIPIGSVRNVYIPGRAIGLGELQINESLFNEQNTIRELRLDRTKLETLPAFTYQQGIGMPELKRKLAPGMLIPGRPGMFAPLFSYAATHAFEDMRLTKENIADATATYDSTKGAPATVNRVSATDSSGRANLALTRHKLQALGYEDALQQFAQQSVALWFQKAPSDLRVRIGGAPDVAMSVSRDDLLEALNIDFRFRGATQAINRDQLAQKLMEIMKDANPILTPPELRATLRVFVDQLQVPQGSTIVTPEGDEFYTQVFKMTQMEQAAKTKMMETQLAAQLNPVPQEVSPEVAASLASAPQGPGVPPGPPPPQSPMPMPMPPQGVPS